MRLGRPLAYLTVLALVTLDLTVWHHMYFVAGIGVAMVAVLVDTMALRGHLMRNAHH